MLVTKLKRGWLAAEPEPQTAGATLKSPKVKDGYQYA
jgi:hypothetical protein